jgi:hypothetical protein
MTMKSWLVLACILGWVAENACAADLPAAAPASVQGAAEDALQAEARAQALVAERGAIETLAGGASYTIVAGGNRVQKTGSRVFVDFPMPGSDTMRGRIELDVKEPDSVRFKQYSPVIAGAYTTYSKGSKPGSWLAFVLLALEEVRETRAAAAAPERRKLESLAERIDCILDKRYAVKTTLPDGRKIETARYGDLLRVTAPAEPWYTGDQWFYTLNLSSGTLSIGLAQYNTNVRVTPAYRDAIASQLRTALRHETSVSERRRIQETLRTIGR